MGELIIIRSEFTNMGKLVPQYIINKIINKKVYCITLFPIITLSGTIPVTYFWWCFGCG